MINQAMFMMAETWNEFTLALKALCQKQGKVLVRLRDNSYRAVIYVPEDKENFISEGFCTEDWGFCWRPSGKSVTSHIFDMIEFSEQSS